MSGGEDGNINAIEGHPRTPAEAWSTLMEGNRRFVEASASHPNQDAARRSSLVSTQHPFVMIFGCSDSRLAAEIIFDLGLGDAFVVRTAGHVIDNNALGSLEYGVEYLDVPLIVVLGHDSCGAVTATQAAVATGQMPAGFIRDLVEHALGPYLPPQRCPQQHWGHGGGACETNCLPPRRELPYYCQRGGAAEDSCCGPDIPPQ